MVKEQIESIQAKIAVLGKIAPLAAKQTRLMAVSKNQSAAVIEEAIEAGLFLFGENRVQEAQTKWPALKARYKQIGLHLIGPLQSNKVREALTLFDAIQTLDRLKIAEAIAKELENWKLKKMEIPSSKSQIPSFFIQVNIGKEAQKSGVAPEEADDFIGYCIKQLKIPVVGLMCIPPHDQPPAPHFALLRQIALRNDLNELSMGMSDDFETAIRMGSTCIRVGRGIFGERS